MAICAVFGCDTVKNKNSKKHTENSDVKLHTFPKDPQKAKIWAHKCGRKDKINVKSAVICSKHFTKDQYKRNLQHELLNYIPKAYRNLKDDAVPTEHLPFPSREISTRRNERLQKRSKHIEALSLVNESINQQDHSVDIEEVSVEIPTSPKEQELQEKIFKLEKKVDALKKEKESLHHKVLQLKHENFKLREECNNTSNIFSATQKKKLSLAGRRVKWTLDDLSKCTAIYASGPKAYQFLLQKGYPFPAVITLKQYATKMKHMKKSSQDVESSNVIEKETQIGADIQAENEHGSVESKTIISDIISDLIVDAGIK